MTERIRVLIAEDEVGVRDALTELLGSDPGLDVVATAADADEAIALAHTKRPDVALLDVKMPAGGGARAAREIRRDLPKTQLVALSAYDDRATVLEMLRAGVVGYMVKGAPAEEILSTIHRSMQGQGSLSVDVTAGVIHELTSLLDRSEALATELADLNRTKSEMIQILSHELFTPITAIQASAMTVAEHGAEMDRGDLQAMLDGVGSAGTRIKRLIGNLSAAARLGREGVELPNRPLPAGALVTTALAEFPEEARLVQPPEGEALKQLLWATPDLAVRALVIVLENALQLSPEHELVELRVLSEPERIAVAVLDRGPGVAEEQRGLIFEAFTQQDASTTRDHEGLGIGLYLTRRIMHAHGGSVTVDDRPGGGSAFTLSFAAYREPAR